MDGSDEPPPVAIPPVHAGLRTDTLERLLEQRGAPAQGAVEAFILDAAVTAERGLWTQEYPARGLRIVPQEGAAICAAQHGDLHSEGVATELTADAAS